MIFLNTGLVFTPEVFILCKKCWGQEGRGREFLYTFNFTALHKRKRTVSKLNETIKPVTPMTFYSKNFLQGQWFKFKLSLIPAIFFNASLVLLSKVILFQ